MDFFPDPWLGHDFGRQWVLTADVPSADDEVKWQYIPYVSMNVHELTAVIPSTINVWTVPWSR